MKPIRPPQGPGAGHPRRLWRSFAIFEGQCSEKSWTYRIAHNVAVTHLVSAKRRRLDGAGRTRRDRGIAWDRTTPKARSAAGRLRLAAQGDPPPPAGRPAGDAALPRRFERSRNRRSHRHFIRCRRRPYPPYQGAARRAARSRQEEADNSDENRPQKAGRRRSPAALPSIEQVRSHRHSLAARACRCWPTLLRTSSRSA